MNKRDLQLSFFKLVNNREKYYAPKFKKAIAAQIKEAVEQIRQGSQSPTIGAGGIGEVIRTVWNDVARVWGARVRRDLVREKARLPIGFSERMYNLIREQYATDFLNMSEGLTDTTREWIRTRLEFAYLAGWSIDQTVDYILKEATPMTRIRARLIARTETVSAANAGAMITAREQGNYNKIWIAANDHRTRHDHRIVNGKTIGMDEAFNVGGFEMMQPGDRGGKEGRPKVPAKEVCNCRCTVGFVPVKKQRL